MFSKTSNFLIALLASVSILALTPAEAGHNDAPLGMINALDPVYAGGADPTNGTYVADSAPAINAALAYHQGGTLKNVYLPAGTYKIKTPINVGGGTVSQCLVGDGKSTIIHVSTDFSSSAGAVINFIGGTRSYPGVTIAPCTKGIKMVFDQPADLQTTATATSAAGTNTITVASTAGISVGMLVADANDSTAIPNLFRDSASANTTVSSISGNVITLSANLTSNGVTSGHTIGFSQPRANFTTLSSGCSLVAGSPGCKYPWAIYAGNANTNNEVIDDVLIEGAWNGVYLRGSTFNIGTLDVGAMNIGLDIDNCYNYPLLNHYRFYNYGFNQDNNVPQDAFWLNFYDGNVIAANLGRTDGIALGTLQSWEGAVNLTSNWTFGTINSIFLDGDLSNLNITASASGGHVSMGQMYDSKGFYGIGPSIYINTAATFNTEIAKISLTAANVSTYPVQTVSGIVDVDGGYLWNGLNTNTGTFWQNSGATVRFGATTFDSSLVSGGELSQYFAVSGTGSITFGSGSAFLRPPHTGVAGLTIANDNLLNSIAEDVNWNGWGNPSYPRVALATSGYTVPAITRSLRLVQGSTVASATLTLPAASALRDNQQMTIDNGEGAAITALTFSPAVGGFSNGSQMAAGTTMKIVWDATAAAWHRVQ